MEDIITLKQRIAELEAEVADWKEYAAEIGKQLAAARKTKKPATERQSTPGFDAFWAAWPSNSRKVNKNRCLARWLAAKLEDKAEEIVAHVNSMKTSHQWTKAGGDYIPAPLVYLTQERFLAPPPVASLGHLAGSLAGMNYKPTGVDNDGHFH